MSTRLQIPDTMKYIRKFFLSNSASAMIPYKFLLHGLSRG